jgi:hypothetical protein
VKSEADLGFVDGDTIRKLSLTPVQVRKNKNYLLANSSEHGFRIADGYERKIW